MNVLVTGGAGLIGMAARDNLAARGHVVVAIDVTDFGRGDSHLKIVGLADRPGLETLIEEHRIDAIVHCGAISGPMLAKGQPLLLVEVNIDGTALLLDLARVHTMRRFVFCSSISVYGNVGAAVITEETALRPTSVYGASKVACEQLVQGFAAEYGLDGVSLRIGRVYGPYRRANCHLGSIIRDAAAARTTEIPCDPDFIYHYVHVDDVAEAIAAGLEAEVAAGVGLQCRLGRSADHAADRRDRPSGDPGRRHPHGSRRRRRARRADDIRHRPVRPRLRLAAQVSAGRRPQILPAGDRDRPRRHRSRDPTMTTNDATPLLAPGSPLDQRARRLIQKLYDRETSRLKALPVDDPLNPIRRRRVEITRAEIESQPERLRQTLSTQQPAIAEIVKVLVRRRPKRLYLTGCGDSLAVMTAARPLLEEMFKVACEPVQALDMAYYFNKPVDADTLVIGLSSSGETPRTVEAMIMVKALGAQTLVLSNTDGSTLMREADHTLFVHAERKGWPTQASTAALGLLSALALDYGLRTGCAAARHRELLDSLNAVPGQIATAIRQHEPAIKAIAEAEAQRPIYLFSAGGPSFAAAFFGARKGQGMYP